MKISKELIVDFLKDKYREILVIVVYILSVSLIVWQINNLTYKQEDLEFDVNLTERQVETIQKITSTEEELIEEVNVAIGKIETLKEKLPAGLRFQDISKMLGEISQNNGNLYAITNCKITENKNDNSWKVDISSINASYDQMLAFCEYVANYPVKVSITSMTLNRDVNLVTGSLTMVFYGREQTEV